MNAPLGRPRGSDPTVVVFYLVAGLVVVLVGAAVLVAYVAGRASCP